MNNERRKEINKLIQRGEDLKQDIEALLEQEQDYFDNIPENLQQSINADKAQAAIDSLESAADSLQESIDYLQESIEH